MVTQLVLRTDKKDKAGRCPVYLICYFDGARLRCASGEKCKPADWNADKHRFRASYPLAEEANQLLARLSARMLDVRAAGTVPTGAGLRAALRPAVVASPPPAAALVVEELTDFREVICAGGG